MSSPRIDELVDKYRQGELSRRSFVRRATALGLSAAAAGALVQNAFAQDATPAGETTPLSALSKAEYDAQIAEAFEWEEPASTGGQVIYGQTVDIGTLNTVLTSDVYSGQISSLIYDGLFGTSVIDGSYVLNGLAEAIDVSADGLTYTVHLRQDVFWHDGEQFDADDVMATYDGALGEGSQSVRVGTINQVLASYSKIDQFTVEFVALDVIRTFVDDALGQFGIIPEHIWGGIAPADWPTSPGALGTDPTQVIGTGPFKFVEWVEMDHVTLVKNENYWDTESIPVIDEFLFRVLPEGSSAVQSLEIGEIDLLESVPPGEAPTLMENPALVVNVYDNFNFNWYSLHQDPNHNTFFVDPKVRQALHYALDRDLIAEIAWAGFASRAVGPQPVLSFAYAPDRINTDYVYDPETAKALLAEAGWADSDGDGILEKDGVKLSFEVNYAEGVPTYEIQLPYMQQAWREVGVDAQLAALPGQTMFDNLDAGQFYATIYGFSWDSTGSQDAMFASWSLPPEGFNSMRYSNPAYDELVPLEKRALDRDEAREILIQQANIVNDDAANGILVFRKSINAWGTRLHNFHSNAYGLLWSLTKSWVEQ